MAEKSSSKLKDLESSFPLHWCIWENNLRTLSALLESKEHDIEKVDPRGRTPLHLAISMGHLECAKCLLRHNADANKENQNYWTALHESTSTGDPEMVSAVLQYRDYQRFIHRTDGIPSLLRKLREAPDFYVEMTWEFTSWVPLVSRMCPSDTYKVYKSGSMVRIDTTLLGFDNMKWERGSRSYVFKADEEANTTMKKLSIPEYITMRKIMPDDCAKVLEIDHDSKVVYCETIKEITTPPSIDLLLPSEDQVSERLTSPVATTYVNTDKIEFERAKTGVWGFRTDKSETINGYDCKVFNATNVQFITKTRMEHLSAQEKKAMKKNKSSVSPLESFLGLAERHVEKTPTNDEDAVDIHNPCQITPEEYFNADIDLGERDIGRPREIATKIQKFKASLSLCDNYPLTLQEQVMPIIDLMAATNAHFRKLKEFITLQLPAGFPVKIEIPVFHVLNARITFGNIFSSDKHVDGVNVLRDTVQKQIADETVVESVVNSCSVDPFMFDAPEGYRVIGGGNHIEERYMDQDDQLLQFAIQQSLIEPSQQQSPLEPTEQPQDNQLSLTEALQTFSSEQQPNNTSAVPLDYDTQMAMALRMSREDTTSTSTQNTERQEQELERREQEELERILALSLVEK